MENDCKNESNKYQTHSDTLAEQNRVKNFYTSIFDIYYVNSSEISMLFDRKKY